MALVTEIVKAVVPSRALDFLLRAQNRTARTRLRLQPSLTETGLRNILTQPLGIQAGDTVFVHSSVDRLRLNFQFGRVLSLLQQIIGPRGTLLFPTYPRLQSYEFLVRGEIFDVRKTPAYTGILAEIARRHPSAVRSLHPTKSVCAIGRYARELVATHQNSPYPFGSCSPYRMLTEYAGKIIGIGVSTDKLSFAHCVEDELQQQFPVRVYHDRVFSAHCINYEGKEEIVKTYAHNMCRMNLKTKSFIRKYISPEICKDLTVEGTEFFVGDATRLLQSMLEQASRGRTIYSRLSYYPRLSFAKRHDEA